ncbi:hypothetical protein PGTUg99_018357 [Puccinia graminis f. sp. tritici]|uniref:HAT C-terminal dimerisation domain-containing protein n=1 Tax=Puccinia graminis f. sp. tritici TaxID=56615 RepID=A0A5B0R4D3_PUCGR|nr:hypothetical protein PGTUg99_018357 [Puccinia graminis f. sp. tritici]
MVRELKKLKWPRFHGDAQWIRCFAHILNLIVQGILRPFGSHKQDAKDRGPMGAGDDSDGSISEQEDPEDQIRVLPRGRQDNSSTSAGDNLSDEESVYGADVDDDESLDEADIENASEEEEEDRYTSISCKQTLAKFRAIAKKLRFSPASKAEFHKICQQKKCEKPHNIERDVRTRWNSTSIQINSIIRCQAAILEWQRHKTYGIDRVHYLDQSDLDLARDLAKVLNLFHTITLQISKAGSARLSNIVIFIDQITDHLSTIISDSNYPPALRNACRVGLKITNKYYSLTDTSPLYRIAIYEYFKLAKWEPEWIAEAIRLAREMWVSNYKPRPITPASSAPTTSSKPITGMLASLGRAAAARGGENSSNAFDMWLAGGLVLNGNDPVNPLKWWMEQKRSGNSHGGLVHMALDVLGCPATSVDVERAFSFGQDYVSAKRHRLDSCSISRGMTVAFYSKNSKIKEGTLAVWKQGLNDDTKSRQKSKRKVIVLDDNDDLSN